MRIPVERAYQGAESLAPHTTYQTSEDHSNRSFASYPQCQTFMQC